MRWLVFFYSFHENDDMCYIHNIVFTYFQNFHFHPCKNMYFHLKKEWIIYAIEDFTIEKFIIFSIQLKKTEWVVISWKNCDDGKFSAKGQTDLKLDAISLNLNPINLCTSNSITENCFRLFVWFEGEIELFRLFDEINSKYYSWESNQQKTCNVEQFEMLTICLGSF